MKNERITEDFVRDHFKNDPLFSAIKLDEQKPTVVKAKRCLAKASKNLTGKGGSPEFIISFPALPDDIIVVECKADAKFHKSDDGQYPASYAVDGVLHYSAFLSQEYNVISIAVSGDALGKLKISTFYQKMGQPEVSEEGSSLLDVFSYISRFKGEAQAQNIESAEITKTAIDLNRELNDYSIVEYERCTLVSAILLALQDGAFKASYKERATSKNLEPTPERLAAFIVSSIKNVLKDAEIDADRVDSMIGEYEKIKNHSIAKSAQIKKKKASEQLDNYVLRDITERLEKSVLPLITLGDKGYDVLGRFYREFIRYAGTDKKTGLVLTPQHVTEFFCDLVGLNVNDVVFDSCCGSGGFLISAMKHMLQLAGSDQKKRKAIKENQLVGIERRTDMFTFACSNMMMSGDGKSHIYQGDSFAKEIIDKVHSLKPTVAFLNPPYDVGEDGQLEFIENALACLQPGGRCAAIVQMSCVTSGNARAVAVRERLLASHTLTGVFSMPDDLFHPVGVITCIMVFEAHKPHPKGFKTFFEYCKDDGFVKTKHMGRVNRGQWEVIKNHWLDLFVNREKELGLSVLAAVTAEDEWCAEAYMETNYNKVSQDDFAVTVRNYATHRLSLDTEIATAATPLSPEKWASFRYDQLFDIRKGRRLTKDHMTEGTTPFIGAIDSNNGYRQYVDVTPNHESNTITVNYNGNGVAEAFYQSAPFWASDDVNILYPKFDLNPYIAMFVCALIRKEKFRFNYGRKWHLGRMKESILRLPVNASGDPDWAFMESYIKSLPHAGSIQG
jgi:type I restriction-modification system DNA methylase subunit